MFRKTLVVLPHFLRYVIRDTKYVIFILFLLITCHLSLIPPVFAAEEFATSYDVLYDIGEDGIATITEKVNLRNLTSEYYANQFKLTIGATQISDIKASDAGGSLEIASEQKENLTTISVKFNQQVAGLGKNLPWTISFKSKDFAEKVGKIWEVRAPRISPTSNPESYNLTLSVPKIFGDPSQISPTPKSQTVSGNKLFLTFDMEQLKSSGVSATFGQNQLFDFDLTYHLENNNLVPVRTNIALPPDTSFQDVIYQRIEPKPLNVTLDNDGNYLAWFRLERGQKMDVKVFGSAKLYSSSKVKNPFLEESLRNKYTSADKYWEKDNPQIISKVNEILGKNPPPDNGEKAKLIFRFVVNFLKYDSSRLEGNIERFGAVTALNNPDTAVCMEFTDLFIALARAAGIPARELNGYAYSANNALRPLSLTKDILHSWPEYWNASRGWVMVDPTWENTTGGADYFSKLDLNHFAFVVKGSSSSEPIPAGSYKYTGQEDTRDVKVSLSDTDFLGHPQIDVVLESLNPVISGFPGKLVIKVTNTGNSFFPSDSLTINSNKLTIQNSKTQKLGIIPPFGSSVFEFNVRTKSLFDSFTDQMTIAIGNQKFTQEVKVAPFILFQTVPLIISAVAAFMVLVYAVILGVFIYRKRILKAKLQAGKS
ncbi:MAG: Transglutaminase protein [uncultured bacterium]|uniref:Transglutaminase domain protein n=1 Tax=Candidatus Daviesbacteria bacterium GW2011_GWC2_40_12 TaxID=1618431 RepID=A0A0G0QY48_9BACT|nr:MAG: Transglutaminase protein [uncultured bacterium]KKR16838.1 MAG: Transglutaminase domain protein [Candidatus Daviesbacteria bacterium GW2011_GWA2_39_33]KKR23012.1 MAG: Transglutaminase domain protein [Candidatus Daviesbacteria bacterium GW2011_GWB1_39_5]KKR42381.1 MAG: Transglutaminase domain protein [Candidatus Daviesbacteria bacterium GW2011_GWC2_40_12]OGE22297.1 MAG: hypothetical protein A2778_00405 [Candidatus Daviesbacteria bacterium RIFCSPHIGHO2_01_FULL_40_24]OGE28384.1 MAG: hypoth